MSAADYIHQSQERIASRFLLTRQLLKTWQDAMYLAIHQPSDENRLAAQQAHAAYKAEQDKAFSQPRTSNPVL